jgi:predicted anti-sigma-YlaC factor YlaD
VSERWRAVGVGPTANLKTDMLNCREITERASDFLESTLPWHVRLQVRLHLMMCGICREYVRQMALVVRTLQRLPRPRPSAEMNEDLLALFRAERP